MTSTTPTTFVRLDGATQLDRRELGGKAWAVNRLAALGFPTPPAFVLTTTACRDFYAAGGCLSGAAHAALIAGVRWLESTTGRTLGGNPPLLVSVRSGAADSMPGMMDTILNVGFNPAGEAALLAEVGAEFAWDIRCRLVENFGHVIGSEPPDDPLEQLFEATTAVFQSWESPRAQSYRHHHELSDDAGTAVIVQSMVFGNRDSYSGTGVLFTRNPFDGRPEPYGEWLPGGQGEDVVSGRMTPAGLRDLAQTLPDVYGELMSIGRRLEADARDVQDIEFTVESGRLWILQTRAAKRSPDAAVRHAVSLCREGVIARDEALRRVRSDDIRMLLRPRLDPSAAASSTTLVTGEPASPGLGIGVVVTTADEVERVAATGIDVVLVRPTTDPNDVHGMIAATAIVTGVGGVTSHAAVVSRELGRPCVVGCGLDALTVLAGQTVTVDGDAGCVYAGSMPVLPPTASDPDLLLLSEWAGCVDPAQLLMRWDAGERR